MTDVPPVYPYSVTCCKCGASYAGTATDNFAFCDQARAQNWWLPSSAEHIHLIFCPNCKLKQGPVQQIGETTGLT